MPVTMRARSRRGHRARSRGGAGQGVTGGDAPRRWRDDGAEEAALVVGRRRRRGRLLVRRSGERRNVCGGGGQGIWLVGGGSVLMGRGGEGAPEGWAPCGIGAGERERERGGGVWRGQLRRSASAPGRWARGGGAVVYRGG
jgi:hypothetical protein